MLSEKNPVFDLGDLTEPEFNVSEIDRCLRIVELRGTPCAREVAAFAREELAQVSATENGEAKATDFINALGVRVMHRLAWELDDIECAAVTKNT